MKQIDIKKIVFEFHDRYTEIGNLQKNLPKKKGKTDYSEIEKDVIEKALNFSRDISVFIEKIKFTKLGTEFILELENMYNGSINIQRDPYIKHS